MLMVYVSGPLRSASMAIQMGNYTRAWQTAHTLWGLGFGVICPHANTYMMDFGQPHPVDFLEGDGHLIRRATDIILMLPGWEQSAGAKVEHKIAEDVLLPITYSLPDLLKWRQSINDAPIRGDIPSLKYHPGDEASDVQRKEGDVPVGGDQGAGRSEAGDGADLPGGPTEGRPLAEEGGQEPRSEELGEGDTG